MECLLFCSKLKIGVVYCNICKCLRKEYLKMGNENVKPGEYCYNIALSKFTEGVNLQQEGVIAKWSPNNLRRIFISPDGIILQYFTTSEAHTSRLVQPVVFKDNRRCQECFYDEKYKPIVSMLVGKRICSCLEEIIYLTRSTSGRQLPESELRLQELVERSKVQSNETELLKNISDRFVRLRALIFMDLTMQELTSDPEFSKNIKNGAFLFADDDYFRGKAVKIYDIHENDWWQHTRLRPQYYSLDAEGSPLSSYFNKVREIKQVEARENRLSSINAKGVSEKLEKFEPMLHDVEFKCKLMYKYLKNLAGLDEISPAFPVELSKDGWQSIRPDFNNVENLEYVKTGKEKGDKIFYKGLTGFGIDIKDKPNKGVTLDELNNDIKIVRAINLAIDEYCVELFKRCYEKLIDFNSMIGRDIVRNDKDVRKLCDYIPKIYNLKTQGIDNDINEIVNSTGQCGLTIKTRISACIVKFAMYTADFFKEVKEEGVDE